jgi:adenylate cyclase
MKALMTSIGRIGLDASDSSDLALRKRLAVVLCAGTLPLTLLWSLIYLAVGAPIAAAIPGFYTVFTPINTAIFARTRNFPLYRSTQLFVILLLPWLVSLSLGGFMQSSAVIIWAALCPLGSLLLEDLRSTSFWILGFVVVLTLSAVLQPFLSPAALPELFVTWFFVLNIGAVISIVFGLLYYFVARRNFFQQQAEMLLLNILPKEISEILKTEQRTIADHYTEASILFADVVGFTPWRRTCRRWNWSICSTKSFFASTGSSRNTIWKKSRPLATVTWSPPACHVAGPITRAHLSILRSICSPPSPAPGFVANSSRSA